MPGQARLGDTANISADAHGCPGCPHPGVGPAIMGSPTVNVNGRPAVRVGDMGMHAACCGPNQWTAQQGSATVNINGKAAFRMNDPSKHCGGMGKMIQGSADVIVGDGGGGGGGGGSEGSADGSGGGNQALKDTQSGTAKDPNSQKANTSGSQAKDQAANDQTQPKPAVAMWKVQWPDGTSVTDVSANYDGPTGPKDVAGSSGNVSGLVDTDSYALTLTGTAKAQGVLQDDDGKAIANAKIRVERTFGGPTDLSTDGSGKYEVDGLVGDEPYSVEVISVDTKAQGVFVDEDGNPVKGVKARIIRDDIAPRDISGDDQGKWEVEGVLPNEVYEIEVVSTGVKAEGTFTDEDGKPKSSVRAKLTSDGGIEAYVMSDSSGHWEVVGLMPGETYVLTVEPKEDDGDSKKR